MRHANRHFVVESHAVEQYQRRIAPEMPYAEIEAYLYEAFPSATRTGQKSKQGSLYYRISDAILVVNTDRAERRLAVTTVLPLEEDSRIDAPEEVLAMAAGGNEVSPTVEQEEIYCHIPETVNGSVFDLPPLVDTKEHLRSEVEESRRQYIETCKKLRYIARVLKCHGPRHLFNRAKAVLRRSERRVQNYSIWLNRKKRAR